MLLEYLKLIPDPRRAKGRQYQLHYLLYFSILAIMAGANNLKMVWTFIDENFYELDKIFNMGWCRSIDYSHLTTVFKLIDTEMLEEIINIYTTDVIDKSNKKGLKHIAVDGKYVRRSFDKINDKSPLITLRVFSTVSELVLYQKDVEDGSTEVPALQKFLEKTDIKGAIITADAAHDQKNF